MPLQQQLAQARQETWEECARALEDAGIDVTVEWVREQSIQNHEQLAATLRALVHAALNQIAGAIPSSKK